MKERLLEIPYPIIVEGKYDRLRLLSVCRAQIFTTDGFGIFKRKDKTALFRTLGAATSVIVLTDSDGAGKLIRSHLSSVIPPEKIIQLHIPKIAGKEARKSAPSAEGTLGVEGMERALLYRLLSPFEDSEAVRKMAENPLSKADFYINGLTGAENSQEKRDELSRALGLPDGMNANALLAAVRVLMSYEDFLRYFSEEEEQEIK